MRTDALRELVPDVESQKIACNSLVKARRKHYSKKYGRGGELAIPNSVEFLLNRFDEKEEASLLDNTCTLKWCIMGLAADGANSEKLVAGESRSVNTVIQTAASLVSSAWREEENTALCDEGVFKARFETIKEVLDPRYRDYIGEIALSS